MTTYIAKYYFEKDLVVSRLIDAETKDDAVINATNSKVVEFEDSKGIVYRFNLDDVKFTTVVELNKARVTQKPF
jgi:hypothetical protein